MIYVCVMRWVLQNLCFFFKLKRDFNLSYLDQKEEKAKNFLKIVSSSSKLVLKLKQPVAELIKHNEINNQQIPLTFE